MAIVNASSVNVETDWDEPEDDHIVDVEINWFQGKTVDGDEQLEQLEMRKAVEEQIKLKIIHPNGVPVGYEKFYPNAFPKPQQPKPVDIIVPQEIKKNYGGLTKEEVQILNAKPRNKLERKALRKKQNEIKKKMRKK